MATSLYLIQIANFLCLRCETAIIRFAFVYYHRSLKSYTFSSLDFNEDSEKALQLNFSE